MKEESLIAFKCESKNRQGLFHLGHIQHECESHLVCPFAFGCVESLGWSKQERLLLIVEFLNEPPGKMLGISYWKSDDDIERAFRFVECQARDGCQSLKHNVAPFSKFLNNRACELLGIIQKGHESQLLYRRYRETSHT